MIVRRDHVGNRGGDIVRIAPIPQDRVRTLEALKSEAAVKAMAKELGIAAGIVLGRMQHERWLPFASPLNHLKARYFWDASE